MIDCSRVSRLETRELACLNARESDSNMSHRDHERTTSVFQRKRRSASTRDAVRSLERAAHRSLHRLDMRGINHAKH